MSEAVVSTGTGSTGGVESMSAFAIATVAQIAQRSWRPSVSLSRSLIRNGRRAGEGAIMMDMAERQAKLQRQREQRQQ